MAQDNAACRTWSQTRAMMQALAIWVCSITVPFQSGSCLCVRVCSSLSLSFNVTLSLSLTLSFCVCVCDWVCVSMCVSARIHTCTFVAHPQCQHPNHNYNVISRTWQCPGCCFTSTSFSLSWIPNAVTLSAEICTALFQTHMFNIFASCSFKEKVGLGVGRRNGWAVIVVEGEVDRKSQATEYPFENAPSISLVNCQPCPNNTTLHHIQTSSGGSATYSVCMSHKPQKCAKRYLLTCQARLCQSLGTAAGMKWTRVLLCQWLEKEGYIRAIFCVKLFAAS